MSDGDGDGDDDMRVDPDDSSSIDNSTHTFSLYRRTTPEQSTTPAPEEFTTPAPEQSTTPAPEQATSPSTARPPAPRAKAQYKAFNENFPLFYRDQRSKSHDDSSTYSNSSSSMPSPPRTLPPQLTFRPNSPTSPVPSMEAAPVPDQPPNTPRHEPEQSDPPSPYVPTQELFLNTPPQSPSPTQAPLPTSSSTAPAPETQPTPHLDQAPIDHSTLITDFCNRPLSIVPSDWQVTSHVHHELPSNYVAPPTAPTFPIDYQCNSAKHIFTDNQLTDSRALLNGCLTYLSQAIPNMTRHDTTLLALHFNARYNVPLMLNRPITPPTTTQIPFALSRTTEQDANMIPSITTRANIQYIQDMTKPLITNANS